MTERPSFDYATAGSYIEMACGGCPRRFRARESSRGPRSAGAPPRVQGPPGACGSAGGVSAIPAEAKWQRPNPQPIDQRFRLQKRPCLRPRPLQKITSTVRTIRISLMASVFEFHQHALGELLQLLKEPIHTLRRAIV